MKKAITYVPFRDGNFGRFEDLRFEKIKEAGFSSVNYEIANTTKFLYTSSFDEAKEYVLKEKELAQNAGVDIYQAHGPWRWPPVDSTIEERRVGINIMERSIRLASIMNCKYWAIHPIMPFGIEDIGSGNEAKTFELNVLFMRELLSIAKEYGVVICLENMPFPKFSLSTTEEIVKVVNEIDDDNFKVCLDTGHVVCLNNETPADAVRRIGNKLSALHVHDTMVGYDYHLMPYSGVVDWVDFGKSLNEISFDGAFCWEITLTRKFSNTSFMTAAKLLSEIIDDIV